MQGPVRRKRKGDSLTMEEISEEVIDLLDTLPAVHPKDHIPTAQTRTMVSCLAACDWPHNEIAMVLGVDMKTLSTNYLNELERGPYVVRGILTQKAFEMAMNGRAGMLTQMIGRMGILPDKAVAETPKEIDMPVRSNRRERKEDYSFGVTEDMARKMIRQRKDTAH